jgi:chain length determinant protein tyrosine kinase EpsG
MAINPLPTQDTEATGSFRRIGDLLAETTQLSEHDVKRVVAQQRKHGMRFGEAARKLGLVSEEDVQRALAQQFRYPYMRRGESSLDPMLVSAYQPYGNGAEAFRVLRSQLMLRWFNQGHKLLAVGSARGRTGSSTVAANLAISFAQLGERTLLIDANFRRPIQHTLFGVSGEIGFSDALLGRWSVEKAVVSIAKLNGLAILPAGPVAPNPHELLSGRALHYLLELSKEICDVVIIDSPAILEFPDAQMIGARAEGYLLVARRHHTRHADIDAARDRLEPARATIVGSVVVD